MAKNDVKITDNPKLKEKSLSDGQISLYLDYYLGRADIKNPETGETESKVQRKRDYLNLYIWQAPRTPVERQQNKETYELARKIRFEREQELKESINGYRLKKERNINFLDYFQAYNDSYTKKDIRMMRLALRRFKDFLTETPEYNKFTLSIKPEQLNKDMMMAFTEYLQTRSIGEGAKDIFQRFKKLIKYAIDHEIMTKNPCASISIKIDDQILRKDVLSLEEIEQMISTHYEGENAEIRKAFIFCMYCGLRYCDVKDLTFQNIDYSNGRLNFEQNKTKGHSTTSGVIIPLNEGLLQLIGEPVLNTGGLPDKDHLLFTLPSHTMCLKALRRWTARAGIYKHITWHCARHSFAVNILNNGANIKTVASLLGHSGLKHTEKYTRAVDRLKEDAINSLPELKL